MTSNEMKFVENIVNFDKKIQTVQNHIKENFNVESKYDEKSNTLYLLKESDNNLQLSFANDIMKETLNELLVNVDYKNKEEL